MLLPFNVKLKGKIDKKGPRAPTSVFLASCDLEKPVKVSRFRIWTSGNEAGHQITQSLHPYV